MHMLGLRIQPAYGVCGSSRKFKPNGWAIHRYKSTNTNISPITLPDWPHPVYPSSKHRLKGSTFLAHSSQLTSSSLLPDFLQQVKAYPSLKRATHCMYAYRVSAGPNPSVHDTNTPPLIGQNDGNESGAGDRLSELLEKTACQNAIVVVSRWYGGVKLGSDRWRMISSVAKESLINGGFYGHTPSLVETKNKKNKKR